MKFDRNVLQHLMQSLIKLQNNDLVKSVLFIDSMELTAVLYAIQAPNLLRKL